jgi:hypothetical protein
VTLAPRRTSTAWAAAQRYVLLIAFIGFICGAFVASATHDKPNHTSAPGIVSGVAVGAVLLGILYWRSMTIKLVIDQLQKVLTIRNLWWTYRVSPSEMADIEEGEEVINRGRYSVTRVLCLQIETRTQRRVWVQASLRNGNDESIAKALESFCRDNGVRCLFTPGESFSGPTSSP